MKHVQMKDITQEQYEVLSDCLENQLYKGNDISVSDLMIDDAGNVHVPSAWKYEKEETEYGSSTIDLGGWVPTEYEILLTAEELSSKIEELSHE